MPASSAARPAVAPYLGTRERRQIGWITAAAVAVFVGFRLLPTGTNLNHMDFRVNARNAIDFCDPANPQFIPVVAATSPVRMVLRPAGVPGFGIEARVNLTLATAGGKPIAPEDLVTMHSRKLHLLIADPSLTDYQHVHPEPTRTAGEWSFIFTPRFGGTYRVFADFTPAATNRSLYANADLAVTGAEPTAVELATARQPAWVAERAGYRFALVPTTQTIRARQLADLKFLVTKLDGGRVPLEPVMEAYAHLVAFDESRSGFAHLHPMEADVSVAPDAVKPALSFKITIPTAGRYVIWAQVKLDGRETFVPFWFDVAP
ncbi:MAG: hypothetical protein H7343_04195 [Undibacterium sp.]|nr:hypothetical protein [Opitutaceae bacterium]